MKSSIMKAIFFCITLLLMQSLKLDAQVSANGSNIFLEALGNGGFASINYDTRFNAKGSGLGARVGIGFMPPIFNFTQYHTIPVAVNYLVGKAPYYLELSAGVTYILMNKEDKTPSSKDVLFYPSFGYRYQQKNGGFTARISICPITTYNEAHLYLGGSMGVSF